MSQDVYINSNEDASKIDLNKPRTYYEEGISKQQRKATCVNGSYPWKTMKLNFNIPWKEKNSQTYPLFVHELINLVFLNSYKHMSDSWSHWAYMIVKEKLLKKQTHIQIPTIKLNTLSSMINLSGRDRKRNQMLVFKSASILSSLQLGDLVVKGKMYVSKS